MLRKIGKTLVSVSPVAGLALLPAASFAADFSSLTSSIDLSGIETAILAIAALLVGPSAVKWGAKMVLRFFG